MRKILLCWAGSLLVSASMAITACGSGDSASDDDAAGGSAGSAGSATEGQTSAGGVGGSGQGGTSAGGNSADGNSFGGGNGFGGGSTGGASAGGEGGGKGVCGTGIGTSDATCNTCLGKNCCTPIAACAADQACSACLVDNPPSGCETNPKLGAIDACLSGTSANECGSACASGGAGGAGGGKGVCGTGIGTTDATCNACLAKDCCTPIEACNSDSECVACITDKSSDPNCATTNANAAAAYACLGGTGANECGSACGAGGAAGAGGASGVCGTALHTTDAACNTCLGQNCCTPIDACNADPDCFACFGANAPLSCSSNQKAKDLLTCLGGMAADECGADCSKGSAGAGGT